jgi:transposase-like protein
MPKNGHTEEEILRALRDVEAGETGVAVCRKYGISQQTLYPWKKKYAGLGSSEKGTGQYAVDTMGLAGGSPAPGAGSAPG